MTTHYQKIQALGNKMASNLETMGVSASFNDGGLTLADKILQIQHFTNGLLLSADKSIDQSGNTVKLTALLIENGETVSGKRVYFHKSGEVVKYTSYDTPDKNIGESWVIKATASSISNRVTIGSDSYSIDFFPASGTIQIWSQGSMVIEKTGGDSYLAYNNGNLYYNGETIDISSYGAPTKVKSVTAINSGGLSVDYGVIGWGTTDDYGVATASYTCTGAGEKTITAVSGSVVSQPYPVIDAIMVDSGTSVKDWSYKNNLEQSSDGTETTLTQTSTSSSAVKRIDNLTPDLCFEMDIKVSSNTAFTGTLFSFREGSTSGRANVNVSVLGDTNYHHLKMWTDSSKVYIQVDNGTTSSINLSGVYNRFYLQFEGGISVTYKNFCYYLI